jgi:threonine synthase
MSGNKDLLPEVHLNPAFMGYRCVICAKEQPADFQDFVCPDCGVDGILDVLYDYEMLKAAMVPGSPFPENAAGRMWRFAPLLPVLPVAPHPSWDVGASPTHPAPRLARHLGVRDLWLKDDTGLPSASLKDRAAAMAMAHAHFAGRQTLACASTGNAAASLAVMSARAGLPCHIFVPAAAPEAKLAQLTIHGADVVRVDGTYDEAFELSLKEIKSNGWYSRNCAHNPLLVEGKKTAALELAWELTAGFTCQPESWPDAVFVPVGDGCIVSSVAKAFLELKQLALIPSVPKVIGVQAAGAAPLARGWARQSDPQQLTGPEIVQAIEPVLPKTLADSISVGIPRNRVKAWQKVAATGGSFLAVEDTAILDAIRDLGVQAGVFAEPSGAAGLAGVRTALAQGLIDADSVIAVLVTGHGLKDPLAAI